MPRHLGVHPKNIAAIVTDPSFPEFWKAAKEKWMDAVRRNKELRLGVVICCDSGRHRSVAIAELLNRVGARIYNMDVSRRDVCCRAWTHSLHQCAGGQCRECNGDDALRRRALDYASELWYYDHVRANSEAQRFLEDMQTRR